ncbi:AraC family transcriptional regulator [Microbulbifer spongiae]|uniref:AraC family transcriptional regulator n=1 Tax=Microbulbifer spongiae TaxID=2944933 RepID=A0ABY9EDJ5_9GAMM|nr:AraC family transcriptional regulator [Microbulbifer sp. MI-G]WKD50071.1 AraC family transcriptional regulator [Microbulbifer sp. MI-G]
MKDPLSDIISLLRPVILDAKYAEASGVFRVYRDDVKGLFYCMLLEGHALLEVDGMEPVELRSGDFALVPDVVPYMFSSMDPPAPPDFRSFPTLHEDGVWRTGTSGGPVNLRQLMGYCRFNSPNSHMLLSLVPELFVVRGEKRLETLAELVREEVHAERPARNSVIDHLLQLVLIEAFRSNAEVNRSDGLFKGLADPHIRKALHALHAKPEHVWSVKEMAYEAGMSRSAFFTQFRNLLGVTPMKYLLQWRMALAKHLLNSEKLNIEEIAHQLGYGSSSAFSTAFTRFVGHAPSQYKDIHK